MQSSHGSRASLRRRRHKRYGKNGNISVRLVLSGAPITGSLFDISAGGCLVWMDAEIPFHFSDIVEVRLQCDSLSFRVLGFVRHTGEQARLLGIEFHRLNQKDSAELSSFIVELERSVETEQLAAF